MLGLDMLVSNPCSSQRNKGAVDGISLPFLLMYTSTKVVRAMLLVTLA